MRCAGLLLALLLSLSALSVSTAEAHKELLGDSAVLLTGRRWLRGRKMMAALGGHGDAAKKDEAVEGKGAKSTGANTVHVHEEEKTVEVTVVGLSGEGAGRQSGGKHRFAGLVPFSADYRTPRTHPPRNNSNQAADAPAEAVHDSGKTSKELSATHAMFQEPRKGDTAAVVPEILGMDYNYKLDAARHHRPINNDVPLDDLAKKP
ncbi:unnamed protein product [Urochloa decumbens]|uniref:Uncharacterized protein n=1 Tax=Urochloa decumbens TaxID=240449 RepID=A0ABC9GUG8_9POAL